jgi:glycosyltransferase involved in cell wall biosynthesis
MVRELGIGGCERDLTKLARKLDRSRFEPHVGCFHADGLRTDELRSAGIPIVRFPVTSFKSWSAIEGGRQMGRYLKEHGIAIVHAFDVPTVVFGVPAARFHRTPVVIATQLSYRELVSSFYRQMLRMTDHLADRVVANSQAVQQYLVAKEGIPPARTYLCYNGVETAVFHPAPDPKPPVVADARLVIGAICALRPEKRLDLLLRAFAKVRRPGDGIKLLLVGSGPVLPDLEKLRTELDLAQDCIFEPAKSEVASWMRAIDIFVMSSESESFPNALLEAMASGCAPVGSRVGGIPELILPGETGLLFDSGDVDGLARALATLIEDPALRQRFSQAAARSARDNFSMEINVRANQALYDTLLEQKGLTTPAGSRSHS